MTHCPVKFRDPGRATAKNRRIGGRRNGGGGVHQLKVERDGLPSLPCKKRGRGIRDESRFYAVSRDASLTRVIESKRMEYTYIRRNWWANLSRGEFFNFRNGSKPCCALKIVRFLSKTKFLYAQQNKCAYKMCFFFISVVISAYLFYSAWSRLSVDFWNSNNTQLAVLARKVVQVTRPTIIELYHL